VALAQQIQTLLELLEHKTQEAVAVVAGKVQLVQAAPVVLESLYFVTQILTRQHFQAA
jgi:ubiquinone biosynthesis protein UbiJ